MAFGTPVVGTTIYSASAGTTVAPTYPASVLATDQLVLVIGQKPSTANTGTVTTPSGWTLRETLAAAGGYGTTVGADVGNTNIYIYTKDIVTAGLTGALTVTVATNGVCWANITRVPTAGGVISYGVADGQRTTVPTTPLSVALTDGTPTTAFAAGDFAIWAMCIPTDVTTPAQFSAHTITAAGVTYNATAELVEPDSTTGNDIGGYVAYTTVATGVSSTAPTIGAALAGTLTNVRGPIALLRIRETIPPTLTVTPGSYSLTGSSATTTNSVVLSSSPGSLILTGTDADLTYVPAVTSVDLLTDPGSYSISGQSVQITKSSSLATTAGALTLTGSSARLTAAKLLTTSPGTYAVTGISADLTYVAGAVVFNLTTLPGAYSLSGASVTTARTQVLATAVGNYTSTGFALTTTKGFTLNIDPEYATDYYVDDYIGDGHYALLGSTTKLLGVYWPLPADVTAGVQYGPTGGEYIGTKVGGAALTTDVYTGTLFKSFGQRGVLTL